jgi:hypothetical protein
MSHPVITWECLESWARQTGRHIEPREAIVIIQLGVLRANVLNEGLNKQDGGKG